MPSFFNRISLAAVLTALCGSLAAQTTTITEWMVPTANSTPLHIAAASSTVAYFTESTKNKLAALNTANNTFTEWTLPAGSMPHGVILSSGTVVVCGIGGNFVGFLNPVNSAGTAWFMPNANSGPSHVDISGSSYFFTEANGNRIGSLTPSTGMLTEWPVPTANSNPWGVAVGQGTQVFFIERATRQLGMLDTSQNTITEWPLAPITGIEHVTFSNGIVYFGDLNSSVVATFDPSTNVLTSWKAPTPNAGIPEVFVSSGGLINFAERRGNKIGLLDPSLQMGTTNTLTPVTQPTVPTTTKIHSLRGTLTPVTTVVLPTATVVNPVTTGGFTEWAVPTPSSQPFGISLSGGTTFFTEYNANQVATLVTQ